jgi:hypothetical protein
VLINIEGEENRGLQYAQMATKLQPDLRTSAGRNAVMALAWVLFRFDGQAEAEKILQQVLVVGQISVESTYYAARILLKGKNRQAARKLLEVVLATGKVFPGYEEAQQLYKRSSEIGIFASTPAQNRPPVRR